MRTSYGLPHRYRLDGIVRTFSSLSDDFSLTCRYQDELDVVKLLATVVHECDHSLIGHLGFHLAVTSGKDFGDPWKCMGLYLDDAERYLLPIAPAFPSREMAASAPPALRASFRFKQYVHPSVPNQSTQTEGIYGLLNEFHAYYWSARVDAELLSYLVEGRRSYDNVFAFCGKADNAYSAYLEFRSYILHYLLFARTRDPALYAGLMENKEFRRMFSLIDEAYSRECERFYGALETLIGSTFPNVTRVETASAREISYRIGDYQPTFWLKNEALFNFRGLEEVLARPEYTRLAGELAGGRLE